MKLKNKILAGYGVVFTLMAIVMAWAIFNIISLSRATDDILRQNYRSTLAAGKMMNALERQDSGILLILLGDIEKGKAIFRDNEADFIEGLGVAKDSIFFLNGEKEVVQTIDKEYAAYRRQFSFITDFLDRRQPFIVSPTATYNETVFPLFIKLQESCRKLRDLNEKAIYNAGERARSVGIRAILSTIIAAVVGLVATLILSLFLSGRVVKPLSRLLEASRKISTGEYTPQSRDGAWDEMGGLIDEFNHLALHATRYHGVDIDRLLAENNVNEGIISSIDDGLLVFDMECRVTSINSAARRMLGLEFMDIMNLPCADIIPLTNVCNLIRKTVEMGVPPKDIPDEDRIVTLKRNGKTYHCIFSISGIKDKDGNISGGLLFLRDITRIKTVEITKNDFIMTASHELRTPLTSMGMSIDLLLEHVAPKLSERDRELIQTAHEEVQRMKAVTSDLLDLSKMEAGKINLDFDKIPVKILFDQVKDVFRNQIEMKNVILSSDLPKDMPAVMADENKIMWVLSNLISNALRYVQPEGGNIRIHGDRVGQHVQISVNDDGPGIPVEYQSKIFQKFVQVNGKGAVGTGLGLAICKEIVRAHRGTIWVESSPGYGSTFTFTLPIAE
jgi:two-component system, NtrC family, sensor histidine kinase KinB